MKLKKSDKIMVLAGKDKGKTGEITRVLPANHQIVVEGINIVKRHTKPSNKNPRGGILEITRPMPDGKVALVCPSCKKPTRIGYSLGKTKERICKKCGNVVK
ncbi:MAG TPA: 50S ribosomal protein L24 [Candidatus Saccharimonadales bacterium]|nr:50S ribosomal protein L24 [Candidatus Saccharimonadales bacterium]